MLIELLALLIFLAFAFAFTLKEEADRNDPWKMKYDEVAAKLKMAEDKIDGLERQIRVLNLKIQSLEASIRRLVAAHDGPLSADDRLIPLPKAEYDKLLNDKALLENLQAENAALRARLSKGGSDRPNCLVTPGFLINVQLLADGNLRVSPAWTAAATANVASVTGAVELAKSGSIPPSQFLARAAVIDKWARRQAPACGFRARVSESHGNLDLYKRQVRAVEQYFYVRRE
jgi:hypothetical protein